MKPGISKQNLETASKVCKSIPWIHTANLSRRVDGTCLANAHGTNLFAKEIRPVAPAFAETYELFVETRCRVGFNMDMHVCGTGRSTPRSA